MKGIGAMKPTFEGVGKMQAEKYGVGKMMGDDKKAMKANESLAKVMAKK